MVIANAAASVSRSGLASASQISYADLKGKTLVEVPNVFVKVGETEIAKGDGGTYPDNKGGVYVNISEKILGLDQPANTPVEVKLIQRTAAIMLQLFKILLVRNYTECNPLMTLQNVCIAMKIPHLVSQQH